MSDALKDLIVSHIRDRGPITAAAFMELALYHPELGYYGSAVRRSGAAGDFFTSVDAGPLFGEMIAAQMVPKLIGATTQRDRPDLVAYVRTLIMENTPERVKAAVTAMMERKDSTPLLEKIDVPALVIHGAEDALIPPTEAEGMHRAIRNSQLELIPLSGHLPNLEQQVAFDGILAQFLKKL